MTVELSSRPRSFALTCRIRRSVQVSTETFGIDLLEVPSSLYELSFGWPTAWQWMQFGHKGEYPGRRQSPWCGWSSAFQLVSSSVIGYLVSRA